MPRNGYFSGNLIIEKLATPILMKEPHQHAAYEIFFVTGLKGEASVMIDGITSPLQDGSLVLIDTNVPHMTDYHQATFTSRYLIEIDPELLHPTLGQGINLSIPEFFQANSGVHYLDHTYLNKIETILNLTYDESLFREPFYEELVLLRVLELLLLINRQQHVPLIQNKKDPLIGSVIKYIIENVAAPLSLESLAQEFFIEKSHLSHKFKKDTGQTVHDFINSTKIDQAKRILTLQPATATQEIADYLSFKDSSYFCKIFKKYAGTSCREFKRQQA